MTSRGLPGFLRRTRRTDFDSSDEDFDYDHDDDNKNNDKNNNNNKQQPQNGNSSEQEREQTDEQGQHQREYSRQLSHTSSVSSLGDDDYLDDPNSFGPYPPFRAGNSNSNSNNNKKSDLHRTSSLPTGSSPQLRHRFTSSATAASTSSLSPPRRRPGGAFFSSSSSPKNSNYTNGGNDYDNQNNSQSSINSGTVDSSSPSNIMTMDRKYTYRESQFEKVIRANNVKISELRKLGWNGIPVRTKTPSPPVLLYRILILILFRFLFPLLDLPISFLLFCIDFVLVCSPLIYERTIVLFFRAFDRHYYSSECLVMLDFAIMISTA